jgi:multidrug efflux pump subunit AcrB
MITNSSDRSPGGLLGYFVSHRTAANLLLLVMVVAGIVAGMRIRAQFFPDVAIDTVTVTIAWSGVGPKEMDEAIVARVEPRLRTVEGVKTVTAVARQGTAVVTVEFQPGWDSAQGLNDVKAALDEVHDLPVDAEAPIVRPRRWRDRVTDVMISGPVGVDVLNRYAEEFKAQLYKKGVTLAEIDGVSDPEVRIDVWPQDLERYKLTMADIVAAIKSETGTQPVGQIESTRARVRTTAKPLTAEALAAIAVRSLPDGTRIALRDVASVSEEGLDQKIALYHSGAPAVIVQVNRDAKGDAIAMQHKVETVVAAMAPTLPDGVTMTLVNPRAKAISDRLDMLIRNGAQGLVIVVVLLFLFLSARTAFWVAAGIPVAMAATIALMYAFGFTFNMVSLFALIICLGIVVDDAIVVGEHADHLARKGLPPAEAASEAASRMMAPVFSASVTTVIAFAVLALIGGRFGRMISDMPFTVGVVILASLLESFLILPAHMRHALAHAGKRTILDLPSHYVNRGFDWFRVNIFKVFVRWVIGLRYPVIAAAVLLLSVSVSAYFDGTVRWRFFSSPERPTIRANVAMLDNASRNDTKAFMGELDRALKVVGARYEERYGTKPVVVAVAKVGGTTGRGLRGADAKDPDLLGSYNIELIDPDLRPYTAGSFIRDWRDEIRRHPLLETLALRGDRTGPGGDDIDIALTGADAATLKAAAEEIKAALARYPAVSGVEDDLAYDRPELIVSLTAKGEALGFTTASIAAALRQRLDGVEAIKLVRGSREVVARVRLPKSEVGPAYLNHATVPLASGGFIALSEIARVHELQGFSAIRRENGEQRVTVTGDLPDDAKTASDVKTALAETILPAIAARHGVSWSLGGLAEQERDFLSEAVVGFILALVGIYLVLAWVFASWTRPVVVMLVIPFGLVGMIWGHWLHATPISMFSIVGLMGMAGIIINDSIVLVTTIDERAERTPMFEAIVEGTSDRLRAVLLTTLTTVGGLAPLLFETSRQAQFLKPTVITLAYGLGFGVVLVLLLTPAMMAVQKDIAQSLKSLRRMPSVLRRRHLSQRPA